MSPIAQIIYFLTNLLMLFLLFRFVAAQKRYWIRGGLMSAIFQMTDGIVRYFSAFAAGYAPLAAIVAIVLGRGLFLGLLSFSSAQMGPHILLSVIAFLKYATQVLFLLLCFSLLLSRYGLYTSHNVFVEFIHDVAFAFFRVARTFLFTQRIGVLFLGSLVILIVAHSLALASLTGFGLPSIQVSLKETLLILVHALGFFTLIIFIHALLSWFRPDPHAESVQILNALASPFLQMVRRFFPWCAVGMMDFSPWVAIFGLWIIQSFLQNLIMQLPL